MMNLSMRNRKRGITAILLPFGLLILLMAGCGPSQKEMMAKDQLERAKKSYTQAKVNPNVETYAPLELQEAGKAVQAAENAKEADDMNHLGYIAERKSLQATTVAEGKVAEKEIARLNTEKAELIAQKQTIAADKAQAQARAEAEKTEAARRMAEAEKEKAAMAAASRTAKIEQNREALAQMNARITERGIVMTLAGTMFPVGKSDLSPDASHRLIVLSDLLKNNPNRNVLVEGYTDNSGNEDSNQALSLERARAVKAVLLRNGVAPERIATVGYGESFPAESNKTAAGRAKNRRVDVIILNEGVTPDMQIRK
jgi:outer membrane protein OmpA-like peptidoglycan-associated protein